MGGDEAVISKGLRVALDKISAASQTYRIIKHRWGKAYDKNIYCHMSCIWLGWHQFCNYKPSQNTDDNDIMQYIAVRQRYRQDVLCVDHKCADYLPCTSVFCLDSELYDESIDATWQEPGNHNKCVVLSKCCQVGNKSRSQKECIGKLIYTDIYMQTCTITVLCMNTHRTQQSLYIKIC